MSYSTEYRTILILQRVLRYKREYVKSVSWCNSSSRSLKALSKREYFWLVCFTGYTRWFCCALFFNYNCAMAICSTPFPNYRCKKHFTTPTHKKDLRDFMAGLLWSPPASFGLWMLPSTVHLNRPRKFLGYSDHCLRPGWWNSFHRFDMRFFLYYVHISQPLLCSVKRNIVFTVSFPPALFLPFSSLFLYLLDHYFKHLSNARVFSGEKRVWGFSSLLLGETVDILEGVTVSLGP